MKSPLRIPNRRMLILALFIMVAGGVNSGITHAAGISWDQLSNMEQDVLKPYKPQWDKYPQHVRQTMRKWARLSGGERSQIKRRHSQWQALSAARRAKVIRKLDRYKHMSLGKRLKLQAWRKWVKGLPKHEQVKLHKELPGMSAKERKDYINKLEQKYGKR